MLAVVPVSLLSQQTFWVFLGFQLLISMATPFESAMKNAIMNQLEGAVSFNECGLDDGLPSGKADLLLANILANVLADYRESLLLALRDKPGSNPCPRWHPSEGSGNPNERVSEVRKVTQPAIQDFSNRSRSMVLDHLRQTSKSICRLAIGQQSSGY